MRNIDCNQTLHHVQPTPAYRYSSILQAVNFSLYNRGGIQAMLIATLCFEQMVSDGHAVTELKTYHMLEGMKEKE